jgi:uncharacterized protein with HEPN domain
MPKDDSVYLGHILDAAQTALEFIAGKSRSDFDREKLLRVGLTHQLQIVGEAARKLSPEYRGSHPEIPWAAITGMRHRIVHDYFSVDEDIVWRTVQEHLPSLVEQVSELLVLEQPGG